MIESEKEEIREAVGKLMIAAEAYARGSTIPWSVIERVTGDRRESRAKYVIGKFRRRLYREREQVTLCASNVGVRLLSHHETAAEIPAMRQRKAYRQIRRALRETATVDSERLSMAERRLLAAQRANMVSQRRALAKSRREALSAVSPSQRMPLRKA